MGVLVQMGGGTRTALGDPSSLLSGIGGEGGGAKVRVQETFQKKFRSGNEEYGPPAGGAGLGPAPPAAGSRDGWCRCRLTLAR